MATKEQLQVLVVAIDALAEKYEISKSAVRAILSEVPENILQSSSWQDLDAIVQEGLVSPGYEDVEEEEVTREYDWGRRPYPSIGWRYG